MPERMLKRGMLILLVSCLLFSMIAPAAALPEPGREGSTIFSEAAFGSVSGIFYDRVQGYVYASDARENRIVRAKMDGSEYETLGTLGIWTTQFREPGGIFYDDSSGYLYVADTGNHRVVRTRMDGAGWETLGSEGQGDGQFYYPRDVWFDPIGEYLYVADTGNNRVVKTKMDGSCWEALGAAGSDKSQFREPYGISYSGGYLYVADSGNDRVVRCAINGTGWMTLSDLGSGLSRLSEPRDVYYDAASKQVYVADTGNHRVVSTHMDGNDWSSRGDYGEGIGELIRPSSVFFDSSTGEVYVADSGNRRVVCNHMDGDDWRGLGTSLKPLDWYFAACTTRDGFTTSLSILNPGEENAKLTVTYLLPDGSKTDDEFYVAGHTRDAVEVNQEVGEVADFSIRVVSDQPVVVERSTYFRSGDGYAGGYATLGHTSPDTRFFFADGSTQEGFQTMLYLQNPGQDPAHVELACFFQDSSPQRQDLEVAPYGRLAVDIKDVAGADRDVAMAVSSDVPVLAERSIRFAYQDRITGEHLANGTGEPDTRLYLAAVTTRSGFDEFIRILNPGGQAAAVRLRYLFPDGASMEQEIEAGASSLYTVDLRQAVGEEKDAAVEIVSDQPVVAERVAFFTYLGVFNGGHDLAAVSEPATSFCFADGSTALGSEEWLDLFNPGDTPAEVYLTYILPNGDTKLQLVTVDARSRSNIFVNDQVPYGTDFSTVIDSSRPILAERTIYFNYNLEIPGGSAVNGFSR